MKQHRGFRLWISFLWLVLGISSASAQVQSSDQTLYNRIDRMERELIDLQRKIQTGALSSVPLTQSDGTPLSLDAQERIAQLESALSDLTRQIQELQQRVAASGSSSGMVSSSSSIGRPISPEVKTQLEATQDGFVVPGALRRATRDALGHSPVADPQETSSSEQPSSLSPQAVGSTPYAGPGYLSAPLPGSGTGSGSPYYSDSVTGQGGTDQGGPTSLVAPETSLPTQAMSSQTDAPPVPEQQGYPVNASIQEQYAYAKSLAKSGDFEKSTEALKTFIQKNPDAPLTSSAYYGLGESYYAQKKYGQAAATLATGYKKFPKDAKAPDMLLKLGMTLSAMNKKDDACVTFSQLGSQYPKAPKPILDKAQSERTRLKCP